jgi:sugar phosphate isomerase/epimerase
VAEMRRSLDVAAELGAKKVVLHPSMAGGMGAFVLDTVKSYAFEFFSEMVAAAQRLGVTIAWKTCFLETGWVWSRMILRRFSRPSLP